MTEATTTIEAEKAEDETKTAETTTETKTEETSDTTKKAEPAKEFVADSTKTDAENDAARAEFEKANPPKDDKADDGKALPDDWRERGAAGDEDALKMLKRHGSLSSVVKKLMEQEKLIRSGKVKTAQPDPKDEKAMAEWRKAEGIPEDPTGYKIPEAVQKRMVDEDKPILSSFTDFAHKKNARPDVVEIASEWYVEMADAAQAKQIELDASSKEEAEDTLRKDWAHGEYKANMTMASRWIEGVPGLGKDWAAVRGPDGKLLGSNPEFIAWAAEKGRDQFGDVAFATSDGERRHTARKEELEKIRDTDFERYEREGLDKELMKITEKELARGKR